jgi:hypothetical protein
MRSAGFVPILDGRPCPRRRHGASPRQLTFIGSHDVSPSLTSLGPQRPHRTVTTCRFPCSQRFDHIFRNEGVTGSNPPSSTKCPGQGDF